MQKLVSFCCTFSQLWWIIQSPFVGECCAFWEVDFSCCCCSSINRKHLLKRSAISRRRRWRRRHQNKVRSEEEELSSWNLFEMHPRAMRHCCLKCQSQILRMQHFPIFCRPKFFSLSLSQLLLCGHNSKSRESEEKSERKTEKKKIRESSPLERNMTYCFSVLRWATTAEEMLKIVGRTRAFWTLDWPPFSMGQNTRLHLPILADYWPNKDREVIRSMANEFKLRAKFEMFCSIAIFTLSFNAINKKFEWKKRVGTFQRSFPPSTRVSSRLAKKVPYGSSPLCVARISPSVNSPFWNVSDIRISRVIKSNLLEANWHFESRMR